MAKNFIPADQHVADLFSTNGWKVSRGADAAPEGHLIIQRGSHRFAVVVKAISESRTDRVIPVLSMAILQAKAAAARSGKALPLAIAHVPNVSGKLLQHLEAFAQQFAGDVSVGVVSKEGARYFNSSVLQGLNIRSDALARASNVAAPSAINPFSDLNQWMLKLLLAAELPESHLHAPRHQFRTGTELAEAAHVSAMSASRFLSQLRKDGYLDDSVSYLKLVRRKDLLLRWSAAAMRTCPEMPCRFLLRAPGPQQLSTLMAKHLDDACLGAFAAADELGIGHVSGVPSYVYVARLPDLKSPEWSGLIASPAERPDLILRQACFPQSTFRGAINKNGRLITDVIQTWLDVQHHPARGAEQAAVIYNRFLSPMIKS